MVRPKKPANGSFILLKAFHEPRDYIWNKCIRYDKPKPLEHARQFLACSMYMDQVDVFFSQRACSKKHRERYIDGFGYHGDFFGVCVDESLSFDKLEDILYLGTIR